MLVNNVPNSVGLEMARRIVPQSILVDVEHAMELEEFFILVFGTCPKASLAIDYIRKKLTVEYEGGVIQDGVSDANSVVHKAMTVMRRLNDISCISPVVDITPSDANIILQTFGTNYGGTAENLQDLMTKWRRKYAEDDSLLITQLKRKVDSIRKSAYDRTALERRGGVGNQPFQVVNKVHEAVKRQEKRIAAIETFQSGESYRARERPQGGGSAPIRGLICWICGGSHAVATCQIVVDRRDNNVPLPADVCELCLHKKVQGEFRMTMTSRETTCVVSTKCHSQFASVISQLLEERSQTQHENPGTSKVRGNKAVCSFLGFFTISQKYVIGCPEAITLPPAHKLGGSLKLRGEREKMSAQSPWGERPMAPGLKRIGINCLGLKRNA